MPDLRKTPDEIDLTFDTRRAVFTDPATHAEYRSWSLDRDAATSRGGMLASWAFWVVTLVLILCLRPDGFGVGAASIVGLCALLVGMWFALKARLVRATEIALMSVCLVSGAIGVGIANFHLHAHSVGVVAAVWACFFHFTGTAARPRLMASVVSPYMVLETVALWLDVRARRTDVGTATFETFCLVSAFGVAFVGAVLRESSRCKSFAQERIIERQKETIARERARSDALHKLELGHQVAERSRDLGEALARMESVVQVTPPSPGERFHKRYRVLRALGAGGMGAVMEVERLTDEQRFALKLITGQVSGATAARFAREAEIGAKVHHPNLVSIIDVGVTDEGAPFLVMDLVRGGSLEDQRARFGDVAWARPLLAQIAGGLSALHAAQVVHRDLKPANVLLDDGGITAKISDFGISAFRPTDVGLLDVEGATMDAVAKKKSGLTKTGAFLGTPLYMAPEAGTGGHVDAAADVFAFGILAFEAMTGRMPFTMPPVLVAMAGHPLPAPSAEGLPKPLADLLCRCLTVDAPSRPTANEVFAALS